VKLIGYHGGGTERKYRKKDSQTPQGFSKKRSTCSAQAQLLPVQRRAQTNQEEESYKAHPAPRTPHDEIGVKGEE
jgi:hypothetical protein